MRGTWVRVIVVAGVACLGAGACASNPARAAATVPLDTPEPPPRVAMQPVPAPEPPPEPEPPPPAAPPPAPAVRTSPPRSPQPAAPTPPPAPAPAATEPARPAPELRPGGAAALTPTAAQVRESLRRTQQKLNAIDRRRLNAGKRADYDSARRFMAQAEGAVKANNLLLAQSSVEKAETLADGLR